MPKWSRHPSSTREESVCVDSLQELFDAIEVKGLSVRGIRRMQVASLRYFERGGRFAAMVEESVGRPLPEPLWACATQGAPGDEPLILAWRSPTETLLVGADATAFAHIGKSLGDAQDGCMVDQTGGLCAIRLCGERTGDLLRRLGSDEWILKAGDARAGRLADLHVMALCVQPGTVLLLVERVFVGHLVDWMVKTVADF